MNKKAVFPHIFPLVKTYLNTLVDISLYCKLLEFQCKLLNLEKFFHFYFFSKELFYYYGLKKKILQLSINRSIIFQGYPIYKHTFRFFKKSY